MYLGLKNKKKIENLNMKYLCSYFSNYVKYISNYILSVVFWRNFFCLGLKWLIPKCILINCFIMIMDANVFCQINKMWNK